MLQDVEEWSTGNPETVAIPSREMRERLLPGDLVKLHFLIPSDTRTGERMWVQIKEVTDHSYIAVLDNDPVRYFIGLMAANDVVEFEARHVASIWIESDHNWEKRLANVRHPFTSN